MKSTIRVDFDRTNNNAPILTIRKQWSEDVRDELLLDFIYKLGFRSNWLRIDVVADGNEFQEYKVSPIHPDDLRQQAAEMMKAADEIDQFKKEDAERLRQRAEEISK